MLGKQMKNEQFENDNKQMYRFEKERKKIKIWKKWKIRKGSKNNERFETNEKHGNYEHV